MPINKFGLSDWKSDAIGNHSHYHHHHHWSKLRNYVRDNALCRAGTECDAETRKIRRMAQPESDDDVHHILTVIAFQQMLPHTHRHRCVEQVHMGRATQEQSWKRDGRSYRPDNSREREMFEEFTDRYKKKVL